MSINYNERIPNNVDLSGRDGREEADGTLERRSGDTDRPRILRPIEFAYARVD